MFLATAVLLCIARSWASPTTWFGSRKQEKPKEINLDINCSSRKGFEMIKRIKSDLVLWLTLHINLDVWRLISSVYECYRNFLHKNLIFTCTKCKTWNVSNSKLDILILVSGFNSSVWIECLHLRLSKLSELLFDVRTERYTCNIQTKLDVKNFSNVRKIRFVQNGQPYPGWNALWTHLILVCIITDHCQNARQR